MGGPALSIGGPALFINPRQRPKARERTSQSGCLFIPIKVFQLSGAASKGRTSRLLDALAQRHFASAIELEAERVIG